MVPLFALLGAFLGWAGWLVGHRLTVSERDPTDEGRGARDPLPLLCAALGAGVLGLAALRAGDDLADVWRVALLMTPLLITLVTDILARLVFPAVLAAGVVVALAGAAAEPSQFAAALGGGLAAGAVAALLVALARWVWHMSDETPLGSGEILIAATIGVLLGPQRTAPALFAGMLLAALAAALLLLTRRARRDATVPYGAFLCLAAMIGLTG